MFELISRGKLSTEPYSLKKAPLTSAIEMVVKLASGELDVARVLLEP